MATITPTLISLADHSANALTLVSLLIVIVTLLVPGLGIMNIMLATSYFENS